MSVQFVDESTGIIILLNIFIQTRSVIHLHSHFYLVYIVKIQYTAYLFFESVCFTGINPPGTCFAAYISAFEGIIPYFFPNS